MLRTIKEAMFSWLSEDGGENLNVVRLAIKWVIWRKRNGRVENIFVHVRSNLWSLVSFCFIHESPCL